MNGPEREPPRRITPVILCGGSGTRLWPLSRSSRPKQMLALQGSETMLQMTAARVAADDLFEAPILVVGEQLAEAAMNQLDEAGTPAGAVIVEPSARNTAPAIALAALAAPPDALLLVMPSDHLIGNKEAFLAAIEAAETAADAGWLVTFGVRPDRAETGFGYIQRGTSIGGSTFRAERFVEKPDAATAAMYLADGGYDWNAGIFLMRADSFLTSLRRHAQGIAGAIAPAMKAAVWNGRFVRPEAESFSNAPAISIDHAVMEHADNVAVTPVDMAWSDIGSWQALYEVSSRDGGNNVLSGEAMALDAQNCLVWSDGPLVSVVGVRDLAVIATADAVLVIPLSESQRIREVVAWLSAAKDKRL